MSADLTSFLSLSLSLSCKFLFSLMVGAVATSDHEPRQSRTKWCSIGKNCGNFAILSGLLRPLRTKWGSVVKNWRKSATLSWLLRPFHRQKLRQNCDLDASPATVTHEMRLSRQKLRKNCDFELPFSGFSSRIRYLGNRNLMKMSYAAIP